jgi:hypothetical protein
VKDQLDRWIKRLSKHPVTLSGKEESELFQFLNYIKSMGAPVNKYEERMDKIENDIKDMIKRYNERPQGKPGTGACICKGSPEDREHMADMRGSTWATESRGSHPMVALLDHRCPKHGEKAQSALWGRHKELELVVTYAQWTSLGVSWENKS